MKDSCACFIDMNHSKIDELHMCNFSMQWRFFENIEFFFKLWETIWIFWTMSLVTMNICKIKSLTRENNLLEKFTSGVQKFEKCPRLTKNVPDIWMLHFFQYSYNAYPGSEEISKCLPTSTKCPRIWVCNIAYLSA